MRIAICWTNISGYAAACWRALAATDGLEVHVVCFAPGSAANARFSSDLLDRVSHRLLDQGERMAPAVVEHHVASVAPDIILVSGWATRAYAGLTRASSLRSCRFVMGMDTPWRGDVRQHVGRIVLRRRLSAMTAVFVPGERARRYALRLGFRRQAIFDGLYAYDDNLFNESTAVVRSQRHGAVARRFVFTGRYVPQKGLDTLVAAYRAYRERVTDPWPLTCCGVGPNQSLLAGIAGVTDLGFVVPSALPDVFADGGVFVFPSRYEPWGVALVEAMATGMPVICSDACGAGADLVRSYFNGLTYPTDDAAALANAMCWMHDHTDHIPDMARGAMHFARAHTRDLWVTRLQAMCDYAMSRQPPRGPRS
jgi:glycosyltransferase involved in cell wall biosynthesis